MKLDTFFDKFELFADALNAVQKMRELILQQAVRGRLVPQNNKDEPASVALQRIASVNSTKQSGTSSKNDESANVPFSIPASWQWVRFGDVVQIRTGKLDANAAVQGGEYPFFTCSKTPSTIDTYSFDASAVILAGNGDFNLKKYSGKFDAYQRTYVIEPIGWELGFCFWLISAQIKRITDNQRGSAIPYLRLGDIADPVVPFPPLAEQKRIVAKVDELMALCDRLEAQQQQRAEKHSVLARAAVSRFADAPTPANLDFIFHNAYAITPADLRKTILTLAVQGKLVPQDPNESISNFIPEVIPSLLPFDAPSSWRWSQFGNVSEIAGGFAFKSGDYSANGIFILRVTNIASSGVITKDEAVFIPPEKVTKELERFYLNEGDILLVMVGGSLGKIGVVNSNILPALLNQNLWRITPASADIDSKFLRLITDFAVSFQKQVTHSTHGHLSRDEFRKKPIAFPPLAEQKRIVAKVDELMKLVDQLETQLAASSQQAEQLMNAIVAELTTA